MYQGSAELPCKRWSQPGSLTVDFPYEGWEGYEYPAPHSSQLCATLPELHAALGPMEWLEHRVWEA